MYRVMSQTWPKDIGSRMENFHGLLGMAPPVQGVNHLKKKNKSGMLEVFYIIAAS